MLMTTQNKSIRKLIVWKEFSPWREKRKNHKSSFENNFQKMNSCRNSLNIVRVGLDINSNLQQNNKSNGNEIIFFGIKYSHYLLKLKGW